MASIVFALCAAALYGSADFLGGLAARRSAVMPVMIFSQLAGSCMLLAVLPLLPTAFDTDVDVTRMPRQEWRKRNEAAGIGIFD